MKKTPVLLKLDAEQVTHLKKQPNQSEYVRNLIQCDAHRETRRDYVWQVVEGYTLNNAHPESLITLITNLSMLLADSITGKDVLPELMEGGTK